MSATTRAPVEPAADCTSPVGRLLARHPDLALLVVLAAVAIVPRLVLQLQAPPFYFPDSTSYLEPAYDLATGQGFTTRLKRPAGYPLLIAVVFELFGPHLPALAAVQHALGIATVGLTYLLGRVCFNRWVGFGAGLAGALAGPQLVYEQAPLTETTFILLLVGLALALIRATRAETCWPALCSGLLLGTAALIRPVAEALLPLALLFTWLRPGSRRARLASVAILMAAVAVVVLPWMFRNLAVYGRFSLGGAPGESLLARTLMYSRGAFVFDAPNLPLDPDPRRQAVRQIAQAAVYSGGTQGTVRDQVRAQLGLSEADTDRLLQQVAFDAIRRQPLTFAREVLVSFVAIYGLEERALPYLWNSQLAWQSHPSLSNLIVLPTPGQEAAKQQPERVLNLYRPARFGLMLPLLAVVGLAVAWRQRPLAPAIVAGSLTILLLVVHVTLDGPVARYRQATEPMLDVLALGAFAALVRRASGAAEEAGSNERWPGRPVRLARAELPLLLIGAAVVGFRLWGLDRFDPSAFGNEYDEGIRLEQLLLMSAGFRPFREIYASQGPLLLDYFYPFFNVLGRSVVGARAPVVIGSVICLAAIYLIARRLGGRASGLAALALLGLSPQFLSVSRLSLAEVPSMAPACVSLWLALLHRDRPRPLLLHASAVCFAAALMLKPMVAVAAVPIALALWSPTCRPWRDWRRVLYWDIVQWGLTAVAVSCLVLLAIGPSILYDQFIAYRQGASGLGALGRSQWSLRTNWEQIRLELLDDVPLVLIAVLSLWPLAFVRRFFGLLAGAWTLGTLLLLLFYSPLAEKHVGYLMPPLALLAGGGFGAALSLLRPPRTAWRIAILLPLGLSFGWYVLLLQPTLRADGRLTAPSMSTMAPEGDLPDVLAIIARLTGGSEYVLTDHPYLAYLANRLVPPRLVDISRTRILSLALGEAEATRQTEAFQPKIVVFWAGRLQLLRGYAGWLERGYSLVRMYDRNRALYVRNDSLAQLPPPLGVAAAAARFGNAVELNGLELSAYGGGRDERVTMSLRALQPVPPETYVVHLELRAADGRVAFQRDDRLLPPWRDSPWQPGLPLIQRRWVDLSSLEAGSYALVMYLTQGRGTEPISASVGPGTSVEAGPGPGLVTLARFTSR